MVQIHLPAELREMFSESPTEDALHGWHSNVNIKGLGGGVAMADFDLWHGISNDVNDRKWPKPVFSMRETDKVWLFFPCHSLNVIYCPYNIWKVCQLVKFLFYFFKVCIRKWKLHII